MRLQHMCKLADIKIETKPQEIMPYLIEEAGRWYLWQAADLSWKELHEAFIKRFAPRVANNAQQMADRKQGESETFNRYYEDKMKLIQAYDQDMSEANKVDWLKGGMWYTTQALLIGKTFPTASELQQFIFKAEADQKEVDNKRIEQERAKELEMLSKRLTEGVYIAPSRRTPNYAQGELAQDGNDRSRQMNFGRGNFGSWRQQGGYTSNIAPMMPHVTCFNCQQPGHIARNCPHSKNW